MQLFNPLNTNFLSDYAIYAYPAAACRVQRVQPLSQKIDQEHHEENYKLWTSNPYQKVTIK